VPPLPNIRVIRSRIHGYGVIATRDIAADEVIAEVEGIVYTREALGDDTYCLWVHDDCYLDMVDQTRWINHSCDPNATVDADEDGSGGAWARITALREIRAGEEITYHYAFSQELAERCACGSPECQGWIVDPDEMPELQARLAREQAAAAEATVRPLRASMAK
jgi:SET domain-containing protein